MRFNLYLAAAIAAIQAENACAVDIKPVELENSLAFAQVSELS